MKLHVLFFLCYFVQAKNSEQGIVVIDNRALAGVSQYAAGNGCRFYPNKYTTCHCRGKLDLFDSC